MIKPKILIIDKVDELLLQLLKEHNLNFDYKPEINSEEIFQTLKDYNILILRSKIKVTKEVIDQNPQLKIISRVGSGMDNIDVQYAESKGLICLNSPEGNRDSVAEHTIGLMLSLLHKIHSSYLEVKQNKWEREPNRGIELMGKTVGIIGYGNVGSAVAERLRSFGVKIIAYDKYKIGFGNTYVQEVSLDQIFEQTDILTLHIPLTSETYYMVNSIFLNSFHKPIYLINTSRGAIVDTKALVSCLKAGKVLGAGLDVIEYEKFNFNLEAYDQQTWNYLLNSPKVIITPHIAGLTKQSAQKLAKITFQKLLHAIKQITT